MHAKETSIEINLHWVVPAYEVKLHQSELEALQVRTVTGQTKSQTCQHKFLTCVQCII